MPRSPSRRPDATPEIHTKGNPTIESLSDPVRWLTPVERRTLLAAGAAILAALTGCAPTLRLFSTAHPTSAGDALGRRVQAREASDLRLPSTGDSSAAPVPIPPPRPGLPVLVTHGPGELKALALTIDDGTSADVVACYVAFALQTGFALTFFPNGSVRGNWEPRAQALRPLIERGQVQIGNHTWAHSDLRGMSDTAIRADLERNDEWIQKTFGITSRPWLRPPYGNRNVHTDGVAASLGFTHIVNWSGTFGDSAVKTPTEILGAADLYGNPGAIILGHANHAPVTKLFGQLLAVFAAKGLAGVTLDQMFGTSRRLG
ncbi:MAG TPA: polysaccharide deacetylase family protein [Candidatus Deferrimicrobium sp.]|nr:polysaccharide deacetylase family protein [Candidatus Deferrimicrobium sp.]